MRFWIPSQLSANGKFNPKNHSEQIFTRFSKEMLGWQTESFRRAEDQKQAIAVHCIRFFHYNAYKKVQKSIDKIRPQNIQATPIILGVELNIAVLLHENTK